MAKLEWGFRGSGVTLSFVLDCQSSVSGFHSDKKTLFSSQFSILDNFWFFGISIFLIKLLVRFVFLDSHPILLFPKGFLLYSKALTLTTPKHHLRNKESAT